jgi:N-acetylglucosaminyl-diphospho-decaprenol L-rhamnosyltransferase
MQKYTKVGQFAPAPTLLAPSRIEPLPHTRMNHPIKNTATAPAVHGLGEVTVSVVSHGHDEMVRRLLQRLCEHHGGWIGHLILTHNVPAPAVQPPAGGWPFRFTELSNPRPAGFGANHNRAFASCSTDFFCVLNPDVELSEDALWGELVRHARLPGTGLAYPVLLNPDGSRQDSERETVTPAALLARHLLKRPPRRIDWISAAFWLVPAAVYRRLGGFDEGFFMYCEDTDFCLRLRLGGWTLRRADVALVHHAVRGSRKPGRHLAWHLRSLLRLWSGQVLRRYMAKVASS